MPLDIDTMQRVRLFGGLKPDTVGAAAAISFLRHYRRHTLIFSAGEPSEAVFFVVKGRVRMFRSAPDGREQALRVMPPGELLLVTGFAEDRPYPASAETLDDCVLGLIRNADFGQLVRSHADLAWALVVYMSHRLAWAHERIYDFTLRNAGGRLAAVLLRLAWRHGTRAVDGRYVLADLPPHRELAELAGISRETATRLLHVMYRDGSVAAVPAGHVTMDPRRLAAWLDAEAGRGPNVRMTTAAGVGARSPGAR